MRRFFNEQLEILVRQFPDVLGKSIVALPKGGQRVGLHGTGLKSPVSIAASISASTE